MCNASQKNATVESFGKKCKEFKNKFFLDRLGDHSIVIQRRNN